MKKDFLLFLFIFALGFGIYQFIPSIDSKNKKDLERSSTEKTEDIKSNFKDILNNDMKSDLLSFDIVRITNKGDAVIAGRSEPNKIVNIFDGNKVIARVTSDANGEWVWSSEIPIGLGIKHLSLKYEDSITKSSVSNQTIIVFLDQKESDEPTILKYSNSDKASVILNPRDIDKDFVLDLAEYTSKGEIILSGSSIPNKKLHFFLNNKKLGNIVTSPDGNWIFKSNENMLYSKYDLKIEYDLKTRKVEFIKTIFKDKIPKILISDKEKFIVKPGNSLWRIARKTLGGGFFYSEIYKTNMQKIPDPNLIFPGQVFEIPMIFNKINYEK